MSALGAFFRGAAGPGMLALAELEEQAATLRGHLEIEAARKQEDRQ